MRLYAIPGPLVLLLCVASYYGGKTLFPPPMAHVQAPVQIEDPSPDAEASRRALATDQQALEPKDILPAINTTSATTKRTKLFEPGELENMLIERSGLLKAKPPIRAGVTGNDFYQVIPFQILSWYPRIVVFPNFVDPVRCDHIVDMAKKRMYPSGLAYRPGESANPEQDTRTSSGTFLSRYEDGDGVLAWVEEKISAATQLPAENGEAFNVLKYVNGQHYDSHMDSFDPKEYGNQPSQRIATVLIYLTDVEEGGETVFKKEGIGGENKVINDWRNCNDGYKYHPRLGDAVLFWDVKPDLTIDPHSLHGGCPVIKGEKWAMTKWIHDKRQQGDNY